MRLCLFCSSTCPSTTIVYGLDVAAALRDAPVTVASGFQSPVERECLKFLLKGTVPLVVCPARSTAGMRIPAAWKTAIAAGRLIIRSAIDEGFEAPARTAARKRTPRRATIALAAQRNRFVASISDAALILHASPSGKLDHFANEIIRTGMPLWTLDDPSNAPLIARGARPTRPQDVAVIWNSPEICVGQYDPHA